MKKFLLALGLVAMASMGLTACGDGDKLDDAIDSYCGKLSDCMGGLVSKSECKKSTDVEDGISDACKDATADYLECAATLECSAIIAETGCDSEADKAAAACGDDDDDDYDDDEALSFDDDDEI
ncbi:MAG: hypothetical protein IIY06_05885 [Proteobacteria bacterium]|nr:hypothetical protein [Pseudomonadota bacterium]